MDQVVLTRSIARNDQPFSGEATPPGRVLGARFVVETDGAEFDSYDSGVRVDLGLTDATPVQPELAELPIVRTEVTP